MMANTVAYWYVPMPNGLGLPADLLIQLKISQSPIVQSISVRFRQFSWSSRLTRDFDDLVCAMHEMQPPIGSGRDTVKNTDSAVVEPVTVVELSAVFPEGLEFERCAISDAFDLGIEGIRDLQRTYVLVTQARIELLTRELLPAIVPMRVRSIERHDDGLLGDLRIFWPNDGVISRMGAPECLTEQQLSAFLYAYNGPDLAFAAYADFRREAEVAMRFRGDLRGSVLASATASEIFLDTLLLHFLWEEKSSPESASTVFTQRIVKRVRSQYEKRIGGIWTCKDSTTAPGRWLERTANVRNRVIHFGAEPTPENAQASYDAMLGLERYVVDRICLPKNLSSYPKTAFALTGEPGLRRRGVSRELIEKYLSSEKDPGWAMEFAAWRGQAATARRGSRSS